MSRLFRLLLSLLVAFACPAWAGTVALILSDNSKPYVEFAAVLTEALSESPWRLNTSLVADAAPANDPAPDLVVAVGTEAMRHAAKRYPGNPVIATLLPRSAYERAAAELHPGGSKVTAIWLDQPPARQAAFLRYLLPGQKRVGMVLSAETRTTFPQFRRSFTESGLQLDSEESDGEATLLPVLNGLLPRVNVLLAHPDSAIYRRDNIKAILITAFRFQRPVVGYSAAFANAGGLAALYSTPAQIARQTAGAIIANGTTLPPPAGPALFAVSINHAVAQSLGLNVPDETAIRQSMLGDRESR